MTDQERIASAKIVYVVALSGCGKSFTGDYLGVMHGFKHVDGGKLLQYTLVPFCFFVGGTTRDNVRFSDKVPLVSFFVRYFNTKMVLLRTVAYPKTKN